MTLVPNRLTNPVEPGHPHHSISNSGQSAHHGSHEHPKNDWQILFECYSGHWAALWAGLYAAFVAVTLLWPNFEPAAIALRFTSVISCIVFAFLYSRIDKWLLIAMCLTLLADGAMIWEHWQSVGLLIFLVAQGVHFKRLTGKFLFFVGVMIYVAFRTPEVLTNAFNGEGQLATLTLAYAVIMFCNLGASIKWWRAEPENPAATRAIIAFTLFSFCEIALIAGTVLSGSAQLMAGLVAFSFYLPSNIMMAASPRVFPKKTKTV